MKLRNAEWKDALYLRRIRNNSRGSMGNTGKVGLIEHLRWFARVKKNPSRTHLYIAYSGRSKIGMGRLDVHGMWPYHYELGLIVHPKYRGKGYGTEIIRKLCAMVDGAKCVARIRSTNQASIRAFEKAGFRKAGYALTDLGPTMSTTERWVRMERP